MPLLRPFYRGDHAPASTMPLSVLVLEIIRPHERLSPGPAGRAGVPGSLGLLSVGASGECQPCRGQSRSHVRGRHPVPRGVLSDSSRRCEGCMLTPSPAVGGFPRKRPPRHRPSAVKSSHFAPSCHSTCEPEGSPSPPHPALASPPRAVPTAEEASLCQTRPLPGLVRPDV